VSDMPRKREPFLVRKLSRIRPLLSCRWSQLRRSAPRSSSPPEPGLIKKRTANNAPTIKQATPKKRTPLRRILSLLALLLTLPAFAILFSLGVEERDVWLKIISGVLASLNFPVGVWAFTTNNKGRLLKPTFISLGLTSVVGVWTLINGHWVSQIQNERLEITKAEAANALKGAGDANERAAKIENDNLNLRGQVATLENQATDADKELAVLQKDAADAKTALSAQEERTAQALGRVQVLARQNLELESRVEQERMTRAELERSLAPRSLLWDDTSAPLNFGAGKVIAYLEHDVGDEPSQAAADLSTLLHNRGWWMRGFSTFDSRHSPLGHEGVIVTSNPAPLPPPSPAILHRDRSIDAARALVKFLNERHWGARHAFTSPNDRLPFGTVKIRVGRRSTPYFDSEEKKKIREYFERYIEGTRRENEREGKPE
jgi:hypothetical protein